MSIEKIRTLTMNSHFFSLLLTGFLSGYNKPCEIKIVFMALPILLHSDSRKKLLSANKNSRVETLFNKTENLVNDNKVSGRVNLAGYYRRYEGLIPYTKKAIIILYSKNKIMFNKNNIHLIKSIKHTDFEGALRDWIRASFYLGIILSKTNEDYLHYFLGVEKHEKLF
ncbi:three component ABC system middle component [Lysinibacillus xylanilyticus]|uniref:three component ABC system middle component n=1 Tax=Lysinibacillus xylanilyticus TaxID=582475 RepID=UPI003CFEFEF7